MAAKAPLVAGVDPNIFIYDNYPGGIGFSAAAVPHAGQTCSARTRELVDRAAECDSGCPSCVGPIGETGPLAKRVAIELLDLHWPGSARGGALMSTIDRLRELMRSNRSASTPAQTPPPVRIADQAQASLRELTYGAVDEAGLPMPSRDEAPALPGASLLETPLGRCIHVDHVFEADRLYGQVRVEDGCVSPADVIGFCESADARARCGRGPACWPEWRGRRRQAARAALGRAGDIGRARVCRCSRTSACSKPTGR